MEAVVVSEGAEARRIRRRGVRAELATTTDYDYDGCTVGQAVGRSAIELITTLILQQNKRMLAGATSSLNSPVFARPGTVYVALKVKQLAAPQDRSKRTRS